MATRIESMPPSQQSVWHPEEDDALVCLGVQSETHDVKTFTFASPHGKRFEFRAGQYFLFDLEFNGETESRNYSISSSPHRATTFSITVKRVFGGKVSNWLHDNLLPGITMKAKGPLGGFIRPGDISRKLLLLSGGSGITPVMSMLRDLAENFEPVDVVFMHAARTPLDIIFREELAWRAKQLRTLRLYFLPESTVGEPSWSGLTGRLSADYIRLAVPDIAERVVMCCGPSPFMAAARSIASQLGVPNEYYREESFDAAIMDDSDLAVRPNAGQTFQVTFSKQARSLEVDSDTTVLTAAKKHGLRIPSSCSNGVCGTCKSRLIAGTVDMHHQGGIRQREIDAGMFLPCCSKPLSDLVIDR
ncbi:UNVERIFIED_ORG: 3-phenylpropionate/trans-cinnamate dioxygenase ferredoxin reductase subunit [Pseudomonas lini]